MDSSGEPSYGNSGALSGGHDSERLARSPGGGDVYGGNPSAYDVASDGGAAVREQRGRQGGDRTPEQEAAAILEAVDGLEPEYEFQSVEGGGNGSPGQAQDSYHGVDDGSLNGPGDRVPRAVEERAVDGGRLNGVARELGVSRTSGGQSEGAERQLYRLAQSGVTSAADVGGPSLEGLNPERERNDVLETLVQQLLRQNEYLKRELTDQTSRSSRESAQSSRAVTVQQETVEEYTRTLLAEMELLSVSAPEGGNKRQRVDEEVALDLINQYELYVGHHDNRCARLKCIIEDLKEKGLEDLLEVIRAGDSHADAAFSVYIDRLFPELSAELKERCVVSLQDAVEETWTWNRRTRRRCMKSQGIVIHAFCEQAKKALEHVSERWDFVHLPVNTAEDLLNDSTYRYLLQQARDGRVRGVVGSPPSRTFSTARYLQDGGNKGLRPIRVPGESVGEYGVKDLTCQEQAQRNVDDTLLMRFLVLTAFSVDSNKGLGIPVPACILESPCPENEMPAGIQGISEGVRQASVWNTPEWELLEGKIGMSQFRFFQGPLGHCKRRPTCIGTNIDPDPDLR
ncbi:hypothetical protein AK812_SmicGene37220 [Symbiodinium microadriaticum]|uniref:Uncharacterized protein n=1 Tax=Symbiodinium microadriaticum TaxID=2951 RepID=A0A1Q9CGV5_SYMMI|nr:hypothetical protein AK812_SmicGene37220 [Symbiodinium microadriaticum]